MVYLEAFRCFYATFSHKPNARVEPRRRDHRDDTGKVYCPNCLPAYCWPPLILLLVPRDTRPEGTTMRAHIMAVLVTGAFLSVGGFSTATQAQNVQAQPAVQDASVKPIGKVITAAGLVTIEHVSAVIVQAALGNQPGQAKIGDPIYLGDVLSTGSDGRVGITFADGTAFDLSSNARMTMTEFIYDPNSKSNSRSAQPDQGNVHFRRRQDCQVRRYEG